MPDILYEFDPDGDVTFIIKDAPESLPHNLSGFNATLLSQLYTNQSNSTTVSGLPTLHIRASSKHLMLASPHFRGTFRNAFQEGNELRSAGHINIKICDWKPVPFLLLMAVFHGQTQLVPQSLCFDWLTEMAILVDYYDCYKAVAMVSDLWTKDFEKKQSTLAKRYPMEWLCITWAFRKKDAFESITKYFQLEYMGEISPDELPISAKIIHTLRTSMLTGIDNVIKSLYDLLNRLRYGPQLCSFECDLMRLGALVKGMHEFGILAENHQPGAGYSFMKLRNACLRMHKVYDSHHCKLMPEVLKVLNKAHDSLKCGLTLESFVSL